MKKRCPKAIPIFELDGNRINYLKNFKLVFNYFANLRYKEEAIVPIGLWKITKECEKNLDIYEDYPLMYKKKYVKIKSVKAMLYIMDDIKLKDPSIKYFNEIVRGYKDFDLELKYLYKSLRNRSLYINLNR